MSIQYIMEKGQPEYAVMPVAEFEVLLEKAEMLDDIKAFDTVLSGAEELIPADVVKRLVSGESKMKVWREFRGLSQAELANLADVAQATVAQMETGARIGSVAVLRKIADALSVDIDDLVS
jgi:DNA-binding XRE family transcriptional regulator